MATRQNVLLLGDESVDWHLIKAQGSAASCWHAPGGTVAALPGGARLLRHLIGQCLTCEINPMEGEGLGAASLLGSSAPDTALSQTMTLCGLFPQETQSKNKFLRI
jgi:hypothetical protein